jgi:uncharacterized protein
MKELYRMRLMLFFIASNTFLNCPGQTPDELLLKNYRPVSIYKIPQSTILKASYPVIDMHSHDYPKSAEEIDKWIKTMNATGLEKVIILTSQTGKAFDSLVEKYKRYSERFELWCGFDYTGFGQPGWQQRAIEELVRCYRKGAKGVGELGDKGDGEMFSEPTPGLGIHIDNPELKPLLQKCAALKMPINIHVAEDQWMYEAPDSTNDGLMNSYKWHVKMDNPDKLGHDQLINSLENAVSENPNTIFIACHLANCCSNLKMLGNLLDKYPNLYADISARLGEIAPIPRNASAFFIKHQDKLVYGTDNLIEDKWYHLSFRILESDDEHFYAIEYFDYHWPLHGLNLPKAVLKKLYHDNAKKILKR